MMVNVVNSGKLGVWTSFIIWFCKKPQNLSHNFRNYLFLSLGGGESLVSYLAASARTGYSQFLNLLYA
jgi:hypothetical protein